jgi:ribosomal protein S18 acetylase RimI-like enzyme
MLETRMATAADAKVIAHHRRQMFQDAGLGSSETLDDMSKHFEIWVARMIDEQKYLGWFALDGERVVAGVGLLLLDWPPHPFDPAGTQRGYLLNVYVEPEFRRRMLASRLLDLALDEARAKKIAVVALHATSKGRTLYEKHGFHATNEMLRVERTIV